MLPSIGDQELALLHYLETHPESSVAEVVTGFGEPRGLARSTVLTVMERLRAKGLLSRRKKDAIYVYRPTASADDVLHSLVGRFVERTLSGSVSPLVSWLARRGTVTTDELAELESLVDQLRRDKDAS